MSSFTVRNVPEDAKLRFRQVAAAHGRSMEEHLRHLIIEADHAAAPRTEGVREVSTSFRHSTRDPRAESRAESRARIERLIELGRGIDWTPEPRAIEKLRDVDFG